MVNVDCRVGKLTSLEVLCESNQIVFQFFQLLSLAFNFCLCHDLVMTLKNPFFPSKRRMNWYFFGSIGVVIVLTFFSTSKLPGIDPTIKSFI